MVLGSRCISQISQISVFPFISAPDKHVFGQCGDIACHQTGSKTMLRSMCPYSCNQHDCHKSENVGHRGNCRSKDFNVRIQIEEMSLPLGGVLQLRLGKVWTGVTEVGEGPYNTDTFT